MASQHSSHPDSLLNNFNVGLTLTAEDAPHTVPVQRWCLLGRFLTERVLRTEHMPTVLANLWQLATGMDVITLEPNLFRFEFYHPWERERVLNGTPWTYDQNLLLLAKMESDVVKGDEDLNSVDIWVQIYQLPIGFRSVRVATLIGDFIGKFQESDQNNFNGNGREYVRIRVKLDVRKSLVPSMPIGREGEQPHTIIFKYERLPVFCFYCGCLGHADRFCNKLLEHPDPANAVRQYSATLRAVSRRFQAPPPSKWLVSSPNFVPYQLGQHGGDSGGGEKQQAGFIVTTQKRQRQDGELSSAADVMDVMQSEPGTGSKNMEVAGSLGGARQGI